MKLALLSACSVVSAWCAVYGIWTEAILVPQKTIKPTIAPFHIFAVTGG
jgi:hypothetical protein